MPSKRRTAKRCDHAITPEAVAAFRRGDQAALHRALGLKPWHPSPLRAEGEAPWSGSTMGAKSWALAVELRAELIEATNTGDDA
jgi:hypothetical protein